MAMSHDAFFLSHHLDMGPVPPDSMLDAGEVHSISPIHALLSPSSDPISRPTSSEKNGAVPKPAEIPQPSSPAVDTGPSIQSLIHVQNATWDASHAPGPLPVQNGVEKSPESSGAKRKHGEPETEDSNNKVRRVSRDSPSEDSTKVMPMTTVVCLHAAVAQKSYGSEKRFLCPPPIVHIDGPVWHLRNQQLSMTVISESGERSFELRAPLDNTMTASFKFLHVTGTAKAKSFLLNLDIAQPEPEVTDPMEGPIGRVWASFESAPVTIISKPSKKTAKTRNIASCILAGGPVSLFNRINSQTVRTKYMTIDHAQLCASNVAWSAFNVNVVRRPNDAAATHIGAPQPVTYGSEIVLSDTHTGISTSPLTIRKVDKGKIAADDGGPVSQMQKIALQRVNPDGSRHYLSAAGPITGGPSVSPGGNAQAAGTHPLLFQAPRLREEIKDGQRTVYDEVDDYFCWTIVGISKFQYTFFDASGKNESVPEHPITPFPTLFTTPLYRSTTNTVELTVSNFFYDDPKTNTRQPLDVFLGKVGPLRHRVYQASPSGPLSSVSGFVAVAGDGGPESGPAPNPPPFIPTNSVHTIVIVEMPPIAEVIKALEEDAVPPPGPEDEGSPATNGDLPPPPSIQGRSLPLLFIRGSDGVGYHSGRTVTCENVFTAMNLAPGTEIDSNWLAAAQAAASSIEGAADLNWTLRIM